MIARLRIASGLILTLFVIGHFINHALGIVSLKAMNDALKYFIQPWRDPIGEALLLSALLVHVGLALYALYQRRSLRMGWSDTFQFASGFLIPILLGSHVIATRGIHEVFGVVEGYQFTLYGMWVGSIFYGVVNLVALPIVWFHACLGWHNWLKYKAWYGRIQTILFAIAILLPTLALAGYASASFRVVRLANNENWVTGLFRRVRDQAEEIQSFISTAETANWIAVPVVLALVFLMRFVREKTRARRNTGQIRYRHISLERERSLPLVQGANLLEQLRVAGISHASVCGGRGRCSTCRVRIDEGRENISVAAQDELKVLARIKATPDIRLACQVLPSGPLSVTALLDAQVPSGGSTTRVKGGEEQEIVVLFADIRGFTQLSEARLPYDTAFLLNRYFAAMGKAIEEAGGHLDKFIGDGVMALFGVDKGLEPGAKSAIKAVISMSKQLEVLNASLKTDLQQPLRIGIGLHSGPAIVGNMGYGKATSLTAIGDTVNISSRLEALTKEHACQLIVSASTVEAAGIVMPAATSQKVMVRGREEPISVYVFESAKDLEAMVSDNLSSDKNSRIPVNNKEKIS